ncbi:UvrD-helicase domain-containing protein [Verrucomicrobiaceae bacterium 227]
MNILAKNLLILASAGSGKTFQLGNRVIGKIALEGVEPERMVALTFTRKAAGEFADSVLTKLAEGTLDAAEAQRISSDLGQEVDVGMVLEKVIQALPRLQLTTLDGFFSRIVRGFQYELGLSGGTFDLLEGERLKTAEGEILEGVMRDGFESRQDFFHAFRKATLGRGQQGVQFSLEQFVSDWHQIWKSGARQSAFGNPGVFSGLPKVNDWLAQKDGMIAELRDESQPKAWNALLDNLSDHTVGTSLKTNTFGNRLFEVFDEPGPVEVKEGRKMLSISLEHWKKWKALLRLAIDCEIASAVAKTQAVGELMAQIDKEHSQQLRRRGMLSFDDVKILLGEWSQSEEARLRRELIDYRLDGRYDHWLLDEFQDTSRAEWHALEPLIDEAVSDSEGSLFIVGDRKQGIYAWRGGDVSLFDDVLHRYNEGLEVEPMDKSYRSCPAVLAVVNAVCGNLPLITQLFGKSVAEQWQWQDHVSFAPGLSGEGKVSIVPSDDEGEMLVDQLRALGIGKKKLSCGVLVRTGDLVKKYADLLRAEGFDVIEAGQRSPGTDHAVGVAIVHLLEWLANPANSYAREVVQMSPLVKSLEKYGESWGERWDGALHEVQRLGYARFMSGLIANEWEELGLYGRRRAEDLIAALSTFDAAGEASPRAACAWIRDLQVNQAPGVAAIQVMTIHKSKGLGFDVVMLPELPDRTQVPDAGKFKVARGRDWLLQVPGKWAYTQHPEMMGAYERWQESQLYETLCLLYVALTRAKRGLYVYLPEEPKSRKEAELFRTPANLVRQSTGLEFPESDPNWAESVDDAETPESTPLPVLGEATAQRARTSPSAGKSAEVTGSGTGRRIGAEVHALFEKIAWLKAGEIPRQPFSAAGKIVEDSLKVSGIHRIFEDDGATLYREQALELILDGKWMSGVVDRLHVSASGIEIIDYKTDVVANGAELLARYRGQMEAYQVAVAKIFEVPEKEVRWRLISTHLGRVVEVSEISEQGELGL